MESSIIFFTRFIYFIWTSRVPNYLDGFHEILGYIFRELKKILDFSRFILILKNIFWVIEILYFYPFFSDWIQLVLLPIEFSCSKIFYPDQILLETVLSQFVLRQYFAIITVSSDDQYRHSEILIPSRSPSATTACRGRAPPAVGYPICRLLRLLAKLKTS